MKKRLFSMLLLIFLLSGVHLLLAQEKRIYNDGIIDYVPLSASFALSAEDFESTLDEIQFSVDGNPVEIYSEPISFTTEGRHFIAYRALDLTGNISDEKIYSVVVDGTPPEGLATVDGPAFMKGEHVYLTANSAVILWAEDNLSGVDKIYIRLDDGKFIHYSKPLFVIGEGYHTAEAYAVDNVGNTTPTYIVQGYVDSSPPEVRIVPKEDFIVVGGGNYTNRDNVYTISTYDAIAGTREILVSLDGSDFVSYTDSFKIQISGRHTVSAKAVDNLGNESSKISITFFVDVVPPKTKLGTSLD